MSHIRNIASARAHSNIAFIKYWGNRDDALRLPANASLSMNLADLYTVTTVEWSRRFEADSLTINESPGDPRALARVRNHLDVLRQRLNLRQFAKVDSSNNFPMGAGIASSASAFAALTLAAVAAQGTDISDRELSALARLGSGSAARSIPAGYVEWRAGATHEESFAETFAQADYWDLVDIIAIVNRGHKRVGSSAGHKTADSSRLQPARVASADGRLSSIKEAILKRDFAQFAQIVEEDSNLMHAVMMTSTPPLFYWEPLSLAIMKAVRNWRLVDGLKVCYTLDAGPNVHCITAAADANLVAAKLSGLSSEIEVLKSRVGGGATIIPYSVGSH